VITALDQHIYSRLGGIKFDDKPLKIYPYIAERDHKEVTYPNICVSRIRFFIREQDKRPGHKVYIPSEKQITIQLPERFGGGTITGPESYTEKPYPTPVDFLYEFQTQATNPEHASWLWSMLLQAIPPEYSPKVNGQYPIFFYEDIANFDELDLPLFKTSVTMMVCDLWVESLESRQVSSIAGINLEPEVFNYPT
jgi:hypothetical protein